MAHLARRPVLGVLGALGIAALPARLAFAAAPGDRLLVVVVLRGGMDGLAAVPPWRNPAYREARRELALPPPGSADGTVDLDGSFGLHPALAPLAELYRAGELAALHAVASPYRERSHFDGQDVLENGGAKVGQARDGWLNRALAALGQRAPAGFAFGRAVPLLLRGPVAVGSWAPSALPDASEEFLVRVAALYKADPVLSRALEQGLRTRAMAAGAMSEEDRMVGRGGGRVGEFLQIAKVAGEMLARADGPRVASLEIGGWDTHAQQGVERGPLANNLGGLADGLLQLRRGLGDAWAKTAVIVVSEFGRTVAPNGTGGTDHGTAGAALLLGGAVKGGRVLADWPGLAAPKLHQGRDLTPTTDLRSVFKGLLAEHLGVDRAALDRTVFPDSAPVKPLAGLVRA
jgi:uncharacterized protein (DUF1501 family)